MKQSTIVLVVVLVVLIIIGFLYRTSLEGIFIPASAPMATTTATSTTTGGSSTGTTKGKPAVGANGVACTLDARICPDGQTVGRGGVSCNFMACPAPNVNVPIGGQTAIFVLPAGYTANPGALPAEATLMAAFIKPASSAIPNSILVHSYPIPAGKSAQDVALSNTTMQPSGQQAQSSALSTISLGGRTFYVLTSEHAGAKVDTSYFLFLPTHVVRFEIVEEDVANANSTSLDVSTLPQHAALLQSLAKLQLVTP